MENGAKYKLELMYTVQFNVCLKAVMVGLFRTPISLWVFLRRGKNNIKFPNQLLALILIEKRCYDKYVSG